MVTWTEIIITLQAIGQSSWFNLIAGFILGIISTIILEQRKEKREIEAVRAMLLHEIDYNLDIARELWKKVESLHFLIGVTARSPQDKAILVKRLARTPLIGWSKTVWQGQQPLIPSSFSESEIRKIQNLYKTFEKVDAILKIMHGIEEGEHSEKDSVDRGLRNVGLPEELIGDAEGLYKQIYNLTSDLNITNVEFPRNNQKFNWRKAIKIPKGRTAPSP